MIELARELVLAAGRAYWDGELRGETDSVHRRDLELNKLERHLRTRLLNRLAADQQPRAARLLVFMSLIRDVERLGDYAKNLVELSQICPEGPPQGAWRDDLAAIRADVEDTLADIERVLAEEDESAARAFIERGQAASRRCTSIVSEVAEAELSGCESISLVLGARYYKRFQGHLLNLLSSVVVPLPQLNYCHDLNEAAA